MLSIPSSDPHEISSIGVDLSIPSLDDHSSLPNFSIRDYVFKARSKDIKTNWPFSDKSLELCVNYGVKVMLPPFQSCSERVGVESSSVNKEKVINSNDEPSNIEIPRKTSEKMESHLSKMPEISKPPSMKKPKLIVKIGLNGVEPSSNLKAASKVCPICKIFSSSSNTKLNAHIDQCLSMDSPIEPKSKSGVVKHRIKPRKTRLMVDIYATAKYCTVEELDWRNGRIWREKPSLPTIKEGEVNYNEEKNKSVDLDEKGDEGVVYIDSNGTKIRILNKIGESSLESKLGVNHRRLGRPLKGGKNSKLLSTFKKKKKHSKFLRLSSPREKTCSYKTRLASRILGDQEKEETVGKSARKKESLGVIISQKFSKFRGHITNSETIVSKGVSSKRTDQLKRPSQGDPSSLQDLEKSYPQKVHNCYEIPRLSPQKGNATSSCEDPIGEYHDPAPMKKLNSFRSPNADVDEKLSNFRQEMLLIDIPSSDDPKLCKNSHDEEKYLQQEYSIDEDPSQVPLKRSTILKIKKKKPPFTTRFEDGFLNEEPFLGGKIGIGQLIGESFDQDFCLIGEDTDANVDGNYFIGIDPITIPGPPGSYLPSPGRTSSDEDYQANSSLTTIQLQSSLDHIEIVDRDSSNSPKSLNSTVTNLLISRSDSKLTENLSFQPLVPLSDEITKSTLGYCPQKEGISVNDQGFSPVSIKVPIMPPIFGDFGSPSPSSPNPVLRLMGKNLTVFNNDENYKIERVETLSGANINQKNEESMNGYYNSSRLNPFYSYQGSDFSPYRGPHMIPNASSSMVSPDSSLVRWNSSVLEGSNELPQNPLSSTNHVRSSLYTSPSMP